MTDSPYQRDYLQIIGMLTALGALVAGIIYATRLAQRPWAVFAVLAVLAAGGGGLARLRRWGAAMLAAGYAFAAVWLISTVIRTRAGMPVSRIAIDFAVAALMFAPSVLAVRWRRFLE